MVAWLWCVVCSVLVSHSATLAANSSTASSVCDMLHGKNDALELICNILSGKAREPVPQSAGFKVIGAGAGRTGTMSLQAAFDILGYRSYHMKEVLLNDQAALWHEALRANSVAPILNALLEGGYDASADEPVNRFVFDLLDRFPDAKVVLTTRPAERWAASLSQIGELLAVIKRPPWCWVPVFARFLPFVQAFHLERGYPMEDDPANFDAKAAIKWYEAHNARVRARVPPTQLLDFEVSQGWEPLCKFLGVSVPDVPFPRINDKQGMRIGIAVLNTVSVLFYASPLLMLLLLWRCCGRYSSNHSSQKATKIEYCDIVSVA